MYSCATVYDVTYDYDQHAAFQSLKTYDWMPVPDEVAVMNELVMVRIKSATDYELKAKGLVKAPAAPDFYVVPPISTQDKTEVASWGYGYGPRSNYVGFYWRTDGVPAYSFEEGSLTLDFVDAKTNHLLWRSSAKADIDTVDSPE